MNLDPAVARKRSDLAFLTVRSARAAAPVVEVRPTAAAAKPPASDSLDLAAPSAPPTPDVEPVETELQPTGSLDLNPPSTPPPAPTPSFSGSLDLDAPATPEPPVVEVRPPAAAAKPPAPTVSGSLDLDDTPTSPTTSAPEVRNPVGHIGGPLPGSPKPVQERPLWHRPLLPLGGRLVLTHDTPAVTITKVSSGIGILTIDAAVSSAGGETMLTCAYELEPEVAGAAPITSLLSRDGRYRSAPPDSRRPVLMSGKSQFDRISVDLRQVRSVRRLLVMLVSVNGTPIDWAGTLILTTHGGARIEVPIDHMVDSLVGAAVAIYQVDGELVVRAELEDAHSVREASQAFGYDGITWIDDRTPLG